MDEYEWKQQYLERLTDLGLSQTEAVSMMQRRFGRRHIDTQNCPRCAANAERAPVMDTCAEVRSIANELARLRAEILRVTELETAIEVRDEDCERLRAENAELQAALVKAQAESALQANYSCEHNGCALRQDSGYPAEAKKYVDDYYALRAENAELKAYAEAIQKWWEEGETIFGNADRLGFMFLLGVWWSERPWRQKEEQ